MCVSAGRESIPRSWPCRVVYFTAYVVGLVLVAAYSAALVSFLTVQRSELPFASFQGLLEDGTYKLGITKGAEVSYFSVRTSTINTQRECLNICSLTSIGRKYT
jgi:hypothetical protein